MSKILVLAPSGIGKTTSLRNLRPDCTGIINCDKKELPLRGWRKNYVTNRTSDGKVSIETSNYVETNNSAAVLKVLKVWEEIPTIKNIVLDTLTHLITKEYMSTAIGKDFKAYQALGKTFYDIIEFISDSKKNLIIMGHVEKKLNENGEYVWELKSHGKMITDLVPASYFTTVLMGDKLKVVSDKEGEPVKFRYVFRTQSEGGDPAKSPAYVGSTEVKTALNFYEDNDISVILEKLENFEHEG